MTVVSDKKKTTLKSNIPKNSVKSENNYVESLK